MIRCEHCGGHAPPGLAHLHGDPCRPLCRGCTEKFLKQRELQELQKLADERIRAEMRDYINRVLPKAA